MPDWVILNFLKKEGNCNLRWYGTPSNIFKDDRILKNDYNYGFKIFKIYNICKFDNTLYNSHRDLTIKRTFTFVYR